MSSRLRDGAGLVALGVVALGTGVGAASVVTVGRTEGITAASLDQRMVAAALGAVCGGIVALAIARLLRRSITEVSLVLAASALVCVGALLAIESTNDGSRLRPDAVVSDVIDDDGSPSSGGATPISTERSERSEPNQFDVELGGTIVLLLALALLITAAVFFGRRTETRAVGRDGVYLDSDLAPDVGPPELDADDRVVAAFRDALSQLELDDTPSARIRAAYAAMLTGLGDAGLPRHPSEPPRRYVERCLAESSLPAGAARELLSLFELARFSTHPLGSADVDLARTALGNVLDQMAVATS